ncbi:Hsp70 family protein [Virgisporangium aurantiacum]|uniref:Hsp70 family protein n=1 Tax=Virgisporangium aurantiacum TaxID=175570 RepID=UPI0019528A42|nr:Hsp70 family protein [Virgisporangium aurantiacum]
MPTGDLAIDYGTSNTVALVRGSDGRTRQLLFDGSPLLPSAVLAAADGGGLQAGRDAVRAARVDPARYEPNPKRRIDESEVLLGERVYPVGNLIAATLAMVRAEAQRITGDLPARVLLTHPVAWGATRRAVLSDACVRAGLPAPTLIPEPVAAATYFAALPYVRIGSGQAVVVYDLGAGTFDVSVVRKGQQGFETLGYNGLDDVGGLDLDAVVVQHALGPLAQANQPVWQRLTHPRSTDDRRHHRMLWDDAREAKETLSRQQKATFPLPLTDGDAMITRAEFERSAQPLLLRTVEVTTEAIRQSRVPADQLAGVFLVGGGSRIPLVATLLHQRQGVAPTALEQPEIVVAEGALAVVYGGGIRQPQQGSGGPPAAAGPVGRPPSPPVGVGAGGGRPPAANPPADRPQSGAGAGAATPGLLWPGATYTPPTQPPTPPLSGPPAQSPSNRSASGGAGSDDPFGPPPAFNVPQQPSMLWPDAPFEHGPPDSRSAGSARPGSGSARPTSGSGYAGGPASGGPASGGPASGGARPTSGSGYSGGPASGGARPTSGSGYGGGPASGGARPTSGSGYSGGPASGSARPTSGGGYGSGPSWPSTEPGGRGSAPPPGGSQGVAQNWSGGARPTPPSTGRAYGRPARARQVFAATDLLWLVPALVWIAVMFGVTRNDSKPALFTIASLALCLLGYPLDTRFGRRLPWWGKLAIPAVGGVAAGVALAATPYPTPFAVLALVATVGVAWLVMRRR